jgi:hypothetical protein
MYTVECYTRDQPTTPHSYVVGKVWEELGFVELLGATPNLWEAVLMSYKVLIKTDGGTIVWKHPTKTTPYLELPPILD